jgi:hypothetical protein
VDPLLIINQLPCSTITFRLDESRTTTTLLPPVPQSTRLLRRNHTTLPKYNLLSSITIRRRHRQIGRGDINKIILQLLGDLLTPRMQRLPTKSRLGRTALSRCPLIFVTNNQKKLAPAHYIVVCKITTTKNNNTTGHTKWNPLHTSQKPSNPNG